MSDGLRRSTRPSKPTSTYIADSYSSSSDDDLEQPVINDDSYVSDEYLTDNADGSSILDDDELDTDEEGRPVKRAKLDDTDDEDIVGSDLEIDSNSDEADTSLNTPAQAAKPKPKPRPKPRARKPKASVDDDHNPRSFAREPQPYKFSYENALDFDGKPLKTISEFFEDLADQLKTKFGADLSDFCRKFSKKPLNVVTFCSGTEAPILAMGLVQKTLEAKYGSDSKFVFNHQASAEIHPAKAEYIEANFSCNVIFRDIIELSLLQRDNVPKPHYLTTMYGGKALVPTDTDIIIAGFACDDFSPLNNVPKALEDKGESGDTFFAIKAYLEMYHPKILILENVMKAPWTDERAAKRYKGKDKQKSIRWHLDSAGYDSIYLKMDTKNHYLPHTRNRGYMIGIWRGCLPRGASWPALEKKCRDTIEALEHAATVPLEAMLFLSDDPRLEVLSQERKTDTKSAPWDTCRIGHSDYTGMNGLGDRHPVTNWKPDGSKELPEWHRPMPGMTERVADSIDVAHKRNLGRGFDDREYNRQLELSQNVFRIEDSTRNGVHQCLTPTNIAFYTALGRRITGAEAAALQGIENGLVNTSKLSEQLLTDMCGNAMSSTVVGTVIFAALLTFQDIFNLESRQEAPVEQQLRTYSSKGLNKVDSNSSHYTPASVASIQAAAQSTVRLCFCEGRIKTETSMTFLKCRLCGHTACSKCGKNPKHDYEPFKAEFINARTSPVQFEELINDSVPKEIDLSSLHSEAVDSFLSKLSKAIPEGFDQDSWNDVISRIDTALRSTVYHRAIRRAESWTLTFDSPTAILKLVISGGRVEWQLFANAKDLPLGSAAGKYLRRFPIARMIPEDKDIVQGPWGFWLPLKKTFVANITSSGPLIPTYTNTAGLEYGSHAYNHQFIKIEFAASVDARYFSERLEGVYVASPHCGRAFNTLHVQQGREPGKKPLAFFFDHELQAGNPAHHTFKFATTFHRLDWGEYVDAIAEFPSSWRQPIIRCVESESEDSTIRVEGTNILFGDYVGSVIDQVDIISHGRFVALHDRELALSGSEFRYHKLPAKVSQQNLTCETDLPIFICEGRINYETTFLLPKNRWILVDRKVGSAFWREFVWTLDKGLRIPGHSEDNSTWHFWSDAEDKCHVCTPDVPALLWVLKKGKYIPYEHPEQASQWEKEQKSRPAPMKVLFRIDDSGNIGFQISLNPATLMHRAKARLPGNGGPCDVKMSFRLVTDHGRKKKPILKPLTLLNNDDVEMAKQPFSQFTLRSEQRRVLTWMLEKENKGTTFTEEEVVESTVNEIGYRGEGRATREILRHGGILAQEVGFGKTVVMLALITEQRAAEAKKRKAVEILPKTPGGGPIPTDATLILMPSHLVNQWHSEVEKFLPPEFRKKVIIVRSGQALQFSKLTIQDIIDADVIIVAWGNTIKPPYLKMMANLAGLVEPSNTGTGERAFEVWYQAAVARVQSNIDFLRTLDDTKDFVAHLENQWKSSMDEASSVDVRVPSKHVTGASYVNSDKRSSMNKDASKKRKRGVPDQQTEQFSHTIHFADNDWKSMTNAILEMFVFKRLVIDELTYCSGWVNSTLRNLKARNRWMLTGTPAKGGHSDIKNLAELLRIHLGVDDFTGLRSDLFTKKTSNLTKAEVFMICQEDPSPAWRERRHEVAQNFLDKFCRKDISDVTSIECQRVICLVDISPSERAIYLELLQYLAATDFVYKRGKYAKGDRNDQIQQVVSKFGDAKPALFLRASHFTFLGAQDTEELCDMIVARRCDQVQAAVDEYELHLKQTIWLSKQNPGCKRFENFKARVMAGKLGDSQVGQHLQKSLAKAAKNYRMDHWKQFYRKPGTDVTKMKKPLPEYPQGKNNTHGVYHIDRMEFELRTWTTKLNNDIEEIINQKRALRFFQNILSLQRITNFVCAHCGASGLKPADVKVMGQCGHLLGLECCEVNDCPVSNCTAYNRDYQKLNGSSLVQSSSKWCSEHGSKIDAIIKQIQRIIDVEDEKALIFAQWTQSTDKLEEALVAAKIPFSDLRREKTSSTILQHFQNGTPTSVGGKVAKVLIMNIGDANAAGSNLTMANHVIFMQPYYTSGENSQENYDAAMTQAIGRARRWGQEKVVHVYHFLTVNTIDVDYYEARNNVTIYRKAEDSFQGNGVAIKNETDWSTQVGTHFAKLMRFDGDQRKHH